MDDDELFNDIVDCFRDKTYCRNEPLYSSYGEELSFAWEQFCDDVKKSKKYSFHVLPQPVEPTFENGYKSDILNEIESTVRVHKLIKEIPTGTKLYRCRKHYAGESANTFSELASPSKEFAKCSNRMSPAGISMFYGSDDLLTAQLEAQSGDIDEANKMVSWGVFKNITTLKLLDFTHLPKYRGIWSGDDHETLDFLHSFAKKISEPLDKDEEISKGYLPTQVLTGYLIDVLPELDGLIYRSAKKEKGKCYVLFYDADECPKHLELVEHETHRMSEILPLLK